MPFSFSSCTLRKGSLALPYARRGALIGVVLIALLSGCASERERIVLLPNHDGSAGAVVVKTAGGELVLDKSYSSAEVGQGRRIKSLQQSAESVRTRYSAAISAQPQRPVSYLLYFRSDRVELTAESKLVLKEVQADLKQRAAPEITVIGHTDSVSDDAYNDALSLERAKSMRNLLIAEGISADHLTVAGRGKREPLVPTAEQVREPRNRRVEIFVR